MEKLTCKTFWISALIRALRTLCQTAVAIIGTTAVVSEVDWLTVGSSALLAAIVSILTSIATGLPECGTEIVKPPESEETNTGM